MARALWKGRIQFGPLDVGVKLYTAVRDTSIHSKLLHDEDREKLQQKMYCPNDDGVVEKGEIIKGYEIKDQEYVTVEPEELDAFEPTSSRSIEVMDFVPVDQLEPRYLDRTYFLGPDADDQVYTNLHKAMENSGSAAVCQWVMRKKSYIGVLRASGPLLTLTTHRYASEVVASDAFELEEVKLSDKEKQIASRLIDELTGEHTIEEYHDEYQAKLQKLIEQKAKGKEVELPEIQKLAETEDNELLSALEKSLGAIGKK